MYLSKILKCKYFSGQKKLGIKSKNIVRFGCNNKQGNGDEEMEWLDKMNAALDYIEDNLTGEIDYAQAAKRAYTSSYNFQRMFSFIADVPLAEYIRRRRLTLAALDFQRGGESVLDIALKYGYDSPVSFARAFQNLHGITPKEAREKGVVLTSYPKISFKITIKGVGEMKYRIEKAEGFRLVGIVKTVTTVNGENFKIIPEMWRDAWEDGSSVKLNDACKEGKPEFYGVCYNPQGDNFNYMIGVESDKPVAEGMKELIIDEQEYVKFECRGRLPEAQQSVWKRIYTEWFPNSGYEHEDAPELEWYSNEGMDSDSYLSEIWIPIRKCK